MKSRLVASCIGGLTVVQFFLSGELPSGMAELPPVSPPAPRIQIAKNALQVGPLVAGPRLADDQLEALSAVVFEARYVTGKDLRILNRLFAPQPRQGNQAAQKEKAVVSADERDIYLVIRAFVREAPPFPVIGISVRRFPVGEVIPVFGDPVNIYFGRSTHNHVYVVEHILAASEGQGDGYREALLKTRHRFAVVSLAMK